jgi:hypothetical protein
MATAVSILRRLHMPSLIPLSESNRPKLINRHDDATEVLMPSNFPSELATLVKGQSSSTKSRWWQVEAVERIIFYKFHDPWLCEEALTHSSVGTPCSFNLSL